MKAGVGIMTFMLGSLTANGIKAVIISSDRILCNSTLRFNHRG